VLVGLISDTHGLLRPEVFDAFQGVELILHAGDVGGLDILTQLQTIAPVHAVFGNTDAPGQPGLRARFAMDVEDRSIHMSHGHELGRPTAERLLAAYDADIVIYGHTHRPLIERADHRFVINPGAAGPRRFDLKPSVAILSLAKGKTDVELRLL
jgi:putative phosphoesterase